MLSSRVFDPILEETLFPGQISSVTKSFKGFWWNIFLASLTPRRNVSRSAVSLRTLERNLSEDNCLSFYQDTLESFELLSDVSQDFTKEEIDDLLKKDQYE